MKQQIDEQAADEQNGGRGGDVVLAKKNAGEDERGQREQKAKEPRPAHRRGVAPSHTLFIGHIFRCGDRARRG